MEELRRLWDFSWWWSSSRAAIIAYILSNIMRKVVGRNYICNYIISSFCPTNNIVYSADPAILLSVFCVGFCRFDFSSNFYRRTTQVLRSLPEYFLLFLHCLLFYFYFSIVSFRKYYFMQVLAVSQRAWRAVAVRQWPGTSRTVPWSGTFSPPSRWVAKS